MLTFLMLVRLSTLCPSAVLQRLDRLVEPLRATCTTKVINDYSCFRSDLVCAGLYPVVFSSFLNEFM